MKAYARGLLLSGLLSVILFFQVHGQVYKLPEGQVAGITTSSGIEKPVTIKVIYDNYLKVDGLKEDWGFSIMIEGLDNAVLLIVQVKRRSVCSEKPSAKTILNPGLEIHRRLNNQASSDI